METIFKSNKRLFIFINTLKNSFMELLPYVIFFSIVVITKQILDFMEVSNAFLSTFDTIILTMSNFLPLLLMINVTINFSRVENVNISLSVASSLLIYMLFQLSINELEFIFEAGLSIYTLSIPYLSVVLLKYLKKMEILELYLHIHTDLKDVFSYLIPFFITVVVSLFSLVVAKKLFAPIVQILNTFFESLPELVFMPLYILFGHLFWFIGLHGNHISLMFFDASILNNTFMTNLTNTNLRDLFTVFGGAGSGLALVIAILINGKDEHWKQISKVSLPFVIFNINEILIYGLPIVFNKYLLIPFIFVPIVDFFIAYFALSFGFIEFYIQDVHWATPTFLNAYIATDGNIFAVLLQLVLLIISTLFYMPFVNLYVKKQDKNEKTASLSSSLGVDAQLKDSKINNQENEQLKIINKNIQVNKIINLLHENSLHIYYQPKIDIKSGICNNFEALLRLKFQDGKVTGPYFLEDLEDGGLAPIIDLWVCTEVNRQLKLWKMDNFEPTIGINLHPDTLGETRVVAQIIDLLIDFHVEFEILERALIDNKTVKENIELIKSKGFKLAIDDFGTGYTSLDTLYDTPCSTVKLDKSLIDLITTQKGYEICSDFATLCDKLGFEIVAEGVEELEQVKIIVKTEIKYIQGYYFSPAIPAENVQDFIAHFESSNSNFTPHSKEVLIS